MTGTTYKALTVWQPWASLIIEGAKPHEFRRWPAPSSMVGQRVVIHAGARKAKFDEIAEMLNRLGSEEDGTALTADKARPLLALYATGLREGCTAGAQLPHGCGIGSAILGKPIRCTDLYPGDERVDEDMWAWPFTDPKPFREPISCKGAQGFWNWNPEARLL